MSQFQTRRFLVDSAASLAQVNQRPLFYLNLGLRFSACPKHRKSDAEGEMADDTGDIGKKWTTERLDKLAIAMEGGGLRGLYVLANEGTDGCEYQDLRVDLHRLPFQQQRQRIGLCVK